MKKQFLLLAVMLFVSVASFAQWTKPAAPAGVDPVSGGQYYIMNVEAGQFLTGAKVWFSWSTSAGLADEGQLNTLNETDGKWTIQREDGKYTFISGPADGRGEMHVDGGAANNWVFTKTGSVYQISIDPQDEKYGEAYAGTCWGWEGPNSTDNPANAIVANLNPEKAFCEWLFISPEQYTSDEVKNYKAAVKLYSQAMHLKSVIEATKEQYPGIDLSAQEAVYNDPTSTITALADAEKTIPAAIKEYIKNSLDNATLANPIDVTDLIDACNIDNLTGDPISKGFSREFTGEGTTGSIRKNTWSNEGNSDGTSMKTPFIENWVGKGSSLSDQICHSDTIEIKPGAYRVTARVRLYNEGGADYIEGASLFGNMQKQSIIDPAAEVSASVSTGENGYFTYNNMLGYYNPEAESYAVVGNDGKLTFGIEVEGANYNWQAHKDYKVYYLGDSDEAVLKARNAGEVRNSAFGEAQVLTQSIKDEIDATILAYSEATTAADIMAALAKYNEQIVDPAIAENAAAWAAYIEIGEKAEKLIEDPMYAAIAGELADYLGNDFVWNIEELELTTEEVIAETKKLTKLYEEAQSLTEPGTDVSKFITNPDFSKGWDGWSHSGTGHGGAGGDVNPTAKCAEAWNSANFDIHQDIENAPVGVYEIQVQGFYRYKRGDEAWLEYFNEDGTPKENPVEYIKETPAYIYANDNHNPMANVFDEGVPVDDNFYTGNYYTDPNGAYVYPNNMTDAGAAFDRGMYKSSAFGLVAKKGDALRIGMKGNSNQAGDSWAIFTRFKLIFQGFEPSIIKPELEKNLEWSSDAPMAAATKAEMTAAVEAGNKALATGEGKPMFDALAAILAAKNKVDASVAIYATLAEKSNELAEAFETYKESKYYDDASALWMEVNAAIEDGAYTDEEAEAKTAEIKDMLVKLSIPDVTGASDDNPIEMTAMIVNNSFETGDLTGWTKNDKATGDTGAKENSNGTYTISNAVGSYVFNTWNGSAVDGGFYVEQTVKYLPEGTYGLMALVATDAGNEITLYAGEDNVTSTIETPKGEATQYTVYFTTVGEESSVKIGVKSSTWFKADNFELFYYGKESVHNGVESLEQEISALPVIYTLSGMQIKSLQKGLNIVRRANGKVAKIIVK